MIHTRAQTTRDNIIRAAYQLFSEKGFDKATTKEIAEHAGVAELTLFRHFKNKHNIFQQVLLQYSPALLMEDTLAEIETLPLREGLHCLTQVLMTHLKKNRNLIRLTLLETSFDTQLKNSVNPVRQKILTHIIAYFKRHVKGKKRPNNLTLEELVHTYLWSISSTLIFFDAEKMDIIPTSVERMCEIFRSVFLEVLES